MSTNKSELQGKVLLLSHTANSVAGQFDDAGDTYREAYGANAVEAALNPLIMDILADVQALENAYASARELIASRSEYIDHAERYMTALEQARVADKQEQAEEVRTAKIEAYEHVLRLYDGWGNIWASKRQPKDFEDVLVTTIAALKAEGELK